MTRARTLSDIQYTFQNVHTTTFPYWIANVTSEGRQRRRMRQRSDFGHGLVRIIYRRQSNTTPSTNTTRYNNNTNKILND